MDCGYLVFLTIHLHYNVCHIQIQQLFVTYKVAPCLRKDSANISNFLA